MKEVLAEIFNDAGENVYLKTFIYFKTLKFADLEKAPEQKRLLSRKLPADKKLP